MNEHRNRTRSRLVIGAWLVLLAAVGYWVFVPPAPGLRVVVEPIAEAPDGPVPQISTFLFDQDGSPVQFVLTTSSGGFPDAPFPIDATEDPEEVGTLGMTAPWRTLLDEIAPDRVTDSEFESSRTWRSYPRFSDLHVHGRSVIFRSRADGPWQCAFGAAVAPEGRLPTSLPIFLVTLDDPPPDRVPRQQLHYWQVELDFLGRRLGRTPHRVSISTAALRREAAIRHDLPIEYRQGVDVIPSLSPGQG